MPFGITPALIAGGSSLLGGVISGKQADKAAKAQQAAAAQVQTLEGNAGTAATTAVNDATTNANQTLTDAQQQQLALLQPYITAGTGALNPLQADIASETAPGSQFSFTANDYANDPAYQYQVDQAQQALERSAAAKGGLFTGGTAKALQRQAVNEASTHLDSSFQRALSTYNANRQNTLNQIAGYQTLLGTGLNATSAYNADVGNTAGRISQNTIGAGTYAGNTGLQVAKEQSNAIEGGANAKAAGDIGVGNAISGALGGVANAANQYQYGQVFKNYGGSGGLRTGNRINSGPSLEGTE